MSKQLEALRKQIDKADRGIVRALARKVGKIKARFALPAHDPRREKAVLARNRSFGEQHRLEKALIRKIYTLIFEAVRKEHKKP